MRIFTGPASLALAAVLAAVLAAGSVPAHAASAAPNTVPGSTAFDDAYFVMEHNTFEHGPSLTGWLDDGFRAVELDIIDQGNWEHDPKGPYVSHEASPGDQNCSGTNDRLGDCLGDVMAWQSAHPGSGPLLVFIDMKAAWDPLNAWHADEVRMLDDKVREILGARVYTADELYTFATGATYAGGVSLRSAVSSAGWPSMSTIGDRIVVAYTGGKIDLVNQTQGGGIEDIMAQPGRTLPYGFFCPDVETNPNELNPGVAMGGMSVATSGQVVCSNLKSRDHYQVTANRSAEHNQLMHLWGDHVFGNGSYTYNYIAVAHGVTAIGRDATFAGDTFGGAFPLVGARNAVPGYFEVRGYADPGTCMDVASSGSSNGTKVQRWSCNGSSAQNFVYTAEGQLRPKHANTLCVDISGGSAGAGKNVHLWDCDGGSSEKWVVGTDGTFRSYDNQAYCLTMPSGNGSSFTTQTCSGAASQRFTLVTVPGWQQTVF